MNQRRAIWRRLFSACLLIDRQGKRASAQKDLLVLPAETEKLLDAQIDAALWK
jgi:hypothetical protein